MRLDLLVTVDRHDKSRYVFMEEKDQFLLIRVTVYSDIPSCVAACTSLESAKAALRLMLL
jgi:hypothetical protein